MNYPDRLFRFYQLPGKNRPALTLFVVSYCLESVSSSLMCHVKVLRVRFCEIYAMRRIC